MTDPKPKHGGLRNPKGGRPPTDGEPKPYRLDLRYGASTEADLTTLEARWKVSRNEAVRRAIRTAANPEQPVPAHRRCGGRADRCDERGVLMPAANPDERGEGTKGGGT